jgi:hypothetical protein
MLPQNRTQVKDSALTITVIILALKVTGTSNGFLRDDGWLF